MPSWDDPEDVFNTFSLVTEVRITSQHLHLMWRQVDKSGSVAEKGTPEIPDGSSPGLARAVSWATGGPNVPLCPWLARQAPTFAHVTA